MTRLWVSRLVLIVLVAAFVAAGWWLKRRLFPSRRPVKVGEIIPHARSQCGSCFGRGVVTLTRDGRRQRIPCRCAYARFLKANGSCVERNDETGQLFWKGRC